MAPTRREAMIGGLLAGALGGALLREDALQRVQAAALAAGGRDADELAGDEDFWRRIADAYTVNRSVINLNNGGVSPSPAIVQDAVKRHLDYFHQNAAFNLVREQNPQVETVRKRLADAFGCDREEMAVTRNASESLEICIYGIDLKAGDEVLTTEQDYPRMITTYRQREQREGIHLRLIPLPVPFRDHAEVVAAFRAALTPRTKVILISHVCFANGQIMPVRDICRLGAEAGIPVVVDGAHAFAHFPFDRDALECDYYGTSLHKWLGGPLGTGFLYVRRERIAELWPLMAAPEPRGDDIRKFEEIGTAPTAIKLGVSEAITLHNAIGPERKAARLRRLRDRWARRLTADKRVSLATNLDAAHSCGIATFAIEGENPEKLGEYLWARHRIVVTPIDWGGVRGVRVSPNAYTRPEEMDLFCEAVEEVLARGMS